MDLPTSLPIPEAEDAVELILGFRVAGKGRPRFDSRTGHAYMERSYVFNKRSIEMAFRSAVACKPGFIDASAVYCVQVVLYRKRRKAKSVKETPKRDLECPLGGVCPGKPDLDNALGTIMDAASSVLYVDDSHVAASLLERRWADENAAFVRVIKLKKQ